MGKKKAELLDAEGRSCNSCSTALTRWDVQVSKALAYQSPNCVACIAEEYDMNVGDFDDRMKEFQCVRPCLFQ